MKKWYDEAPEIERELLKKLINNGQFEILNGGWGINDETISHYTGIIEERFHFKAEKLDEMKSFSSIPHFKVLLTYN